MKSGEEMSEEEWQRLMAKLEKAPYDSEVMQLLSELMPELKGIIQELLKK
jgi:hypothetical protein